MANAFAKKCMAPTAAAVRTFAADAKILVAVAYTISIALCDDGTSIVVLAVALASAAALGRIPARRALRGLKPIACLVVFALAISAFSGDAEGFRDGILYSAKLVLLFAATALLVDTTPLPDLADALRRALKPLGRLGLNIDDASVTISLAFRFLSVFADEARRITLAQRSRGLSAQTDGLVGRVKTFGPVVIPLIVSLFRHAERVAVTLESRCFAAGKRTYLASRRPRATDIAIGAVMSACLLAAALAL